MKKNEMKEFMFEGYIIPLIMMKFRGADRDNIVMMTLKYDNFQEFVDEFSNHFDMLKLLSTKQILTNMVKLYIKLQTQNSLCQYHHNWNINEVGDFENFEEVINECIDENKDKLLEKIKQHFPQIYKKYGD